MSHQNYFNPRSLAGATGRGALHILHGIDFNPRSLAGATGKNYVMCPTCRISIHAPSRERLKNQLLYVDEQHFNPRSLAGATDALAVMMLHSAISIHAPSRERPAAPAAWH